MSAADSQGQTIWIADAHRGDGKRFVVRADEKLSAFMELQSRIRVLVFCIDKLAGLTPFPLNVAYASVEETGDGTYTHCRRRAAHRHDLDD
jgi:hypothetical protein